MDSRAISRAFDWGWTYVSWVMLTLLWPSQRETEARDSPKPPELLGARLHEA